jgi:hypothetical protein
VHQRLHLGYLTVVCDSPGQGGYLGGYLVTNAWGRPLEFRLSSPVQPSKLHQILYGPHLKPYVFAEVIGKTLVEKAALPADLILTDCEPALDLRQHLAVPVVLVPPPPSAGTAASGQRFVCHPRFPEDAEAVRRLLEAVELPGELDEPFGRIREALAEARKAGVWNRAA